MQVSRSPLVTATIPIFQRAFLLWVLSMPAAMSCHPQTVIISVYDYSDVSARETVRATQAAGLAMGAGIPIVWRYCRGELAVQSEVSCAGELEFNEIVVRLQPRGPRDTVNERKLVLGQAIVTAEGGSYVTISVSAVRAQAAEFGMDFALLLGYAVAHEVGHCVLGPDHSYAGLMRGIWDRKDALDMSRRRFHLTEQEARTAARRLTPAELTAKRLPEQPSASRSR